MYEPSFAEIVVALMATLGVNVWLGRRDPRAHVLGYGAAAATALGVAAGAYAVSMENASIVRPARLGALAIVLGCLLMSLGWAVVARRWPVLDDE
jgi:hypothetical protein